MNVLVASKFWYPRGGLERVMFDEIAALEAAGHRVAHFATTHPANVPSPWSAYFTPYIELGKDAENGVVDRLRAAVRMFHNRGAARSIATLIDDFVPDVLHVHGIHRQISPSILQVARRARVPVVHTLHDYHHVCPGDVLLRGGVVPCDVECWRFAHLPAVRYRCVRGSLAASALSAAETAFQRGRGVYERCVDRFIAPSRFLRDRVTDAGWGVPVSVLPNAVQPRRIERCVTGDPVFLFVGRLSPEKGVDIALAAAAEANCELIVAGDGPLRGELSERWPSATFLGHIRPEEISQLLGRVSAVVVPSVCHENAPMSVLEAMSAGTPVIASRIGGIPELADDGCQGLLVEPGSVEELAAAMSRIADDRVLADALGRAGLQRVTAEFGPDTHLEGLVGIYEDVISSRRAS